MTYTFYKLLHVLGVLLLFVALGGALGGGGREPIGRRLVSITHGLGILLLLVAGFGMVARLGIAWPYPLWLWGKIAVWLVLGGGLALLWRRPQLARPLWWAVPLLGFVAVWLAIAKP